MHRNQLQRQRIELPDLWFTDTWRALSSWPEAQSLVFLGGPRSEQSLLVLSWFEQPFEEFLQTPVTSEQDSSQQKWTTGQLGLISYDQFHPGSAASGTAARSLRVLRALCLDHLRREAFLCSESGWENCSEQLVWPPSGTPRQIVTQAIKWQSNWRDQDYRNAVEEVLGDIRRGRYYQVNLLRYWQTLDSPDRWHWLCQLQSRGGPFAAYIDLPDLKLISFSPERLLKTGRTGDVNWIETEPIKGTRPVSANAEQDETWRNELMTSHKDAAELNIIVDLLRNDLQKICRPGSVKVLDPGSLHSFTNVHHRIARIRGQLQADLTLVLVLEALCPGGSITGAPKREVIGAIRELEGRDRAWFMGNIFFKDRASGHLDSSILIRTAVKHRQGPWEFAAGSGLVIHSEAEEELQEIQAKARVLGADFFQ